jgi:hypothetical protein
MRSAQQWSIPGREVSNIKQILNKHEQHLYDMKSPAKPFDGAFLPAVIFFHALIL